MNRIRLLSEQVANQIAAGEVVERPASVVKELVENALDARATRVTVEIQAGGRSLIRVTDDGIGMSRDDALLCLERHATSKIQSARDLGAITTMGFRGEALPSIASVSRFLLTTRERDSADPEATQLVVVGGKLVEVRTAGVPPGTAVEVRQLFFNVPARKKFLRTEETEFAHIQHYLTVAALAHPHVGFTLVKDGRTAWQFPPGAATHDLDGAFAAVGDRLRSLLGEGVGLLRVVYASELPPVPSAALEQDREAFEDLASPMLRVWGFIGEPGVSRGNRDHHYVFVNRRPVENRGINFALLEGCHTTLMKGRYPVCCLFIEIDPARVDVNIHPTKREVKFHNEQDVRRRVAEAVRQTLLAHHAESPGLRMEERPEVHPPRSRPSPGPAPSPVAVAAMHTPELLPAPPVMPLLASPPALVPAASAPPADPVFAAPAPTLRPFGDTPVFRGSGTAVPAPTVTPAAAMAASQPLLQGSLRIVGVVGRLYVVLESDQGLVLMDQHAAHERILFEQMLQRLEQGQAPSQRLLLPETVELPPKDAGFVRELLPTLTRLGVGLSEFGERTFLLDGVPPFVRMTDARLFVTGLIDELKEAGESVNAMRLGEDTIAKTVCRYAVKANDPLAGPELDSLLHDLRECRMPYTCPHGRPTLIEMKYRELEKRFGRSQ
jgi:DNA mismatch repair protein MutL